MHIDAFSGLRRALAASLLSGLLVAPPLQAMEIAGVRLDERIRTGSGELQLNGAGVRSKFFIDIYVGALYVTDKSSSPAAIIDAGSTRRIVMHMRRDLDAEALTSALEEGLAENHPPAELVALAPQATQLSAIMRGVGKVAAGDAVAIDFRADGVELSINGAVCGQVAGEAFARALLKVWLGERPVDAGLKAALLGS